MLTGSLYYLSLAVLIIVHLRQFYLTTGDGSTSDIIKLVYLSLSIWKRLLKIR